MTTVSRRSTGALIAQLIAILVGCSSRHPSLCDPDSQTVDFGNPEGYMVHTLTADSLCSGQAAIDGVMLDTSSVEAIDASVQAIRDSIQAPTTVEETSGESPDLSIDFTAAAPPVPPTFHGANLQWRSKYYLANPAWRALLKHMRLDILRFPGGQERVRYDRDVPAGTLDQDTLVVTPDQPYEYRLTGEDVRSFIQLCEDMGIIAEPEVNLTIDDATMWKEMLDQIVNELGYDLKYVSVGNEPDVDSPNGNWPYLGATRGDADTRPVALATYMERYRRYYPEMQEVRADLTLALGELAIWTDGQLGVEPYLNPILDEIGGYDPGAVSGHWYMLGNSGQPSTDTNFPSLGHLVVQGNADNNIGYLANIAEGLRSKAAEHDLQNTKLFIGEWGISWSATSVDNLVSGRLAAAIFNAEAQEFGKTVGFDSMQWFGISDPASWTSWVPSLIAVDDAGNVSVRPQYYVYLMYKYFYGDHIVRVPGGQNPDWSVYASRDQTRSYLMLINRSPSTRFTKVVAVKTAAGEKQLRLTIHPHSVSIVAF
jgi:hypothetical protein